MIPAAFDYYRARTAEDAAGKLAEYGDEAKVLAGGHSLLPLMRLRFAAPTAIVDIGDLDELRFVRRQGDVVRVGALTRHRDLDFDPVIRTYVPLLSLTAAQVGDPQVRNRGTIGGSVAHADPAADYPAALVALGATIATDRRKIAADGFFTGLFQTALERDEIVTAVHFPAPKRAGYAKFAHRASKYAVVGVMVAETTSGVRVAVTGAGSWVFRVPPMEAALAKQFAPSAIDGVIVAPADLNSDAEASAEYRAHLVGVMAKRAVQAALA
jgi:carbon-monoxide dehydrogenase medium subunit